jgi:Holliday junction resolvase RusA-like endonuclease
MPPGRPERASLRIAGIPAPKGSRIPGHRNDGSIFTRPASAGEKSWIEAVAYAARANRPGGKVLEPPYELELVVSMPEPAKPKYGWPSRGDGDKLERAILDGLVKGGLLVDDRHIVECRWRKEFGVPGVAVTVR